jgi:hypothetical protein
MMAITLAMAGVAGLAQLLATVACDRRTARQHIVAVQEAGNLMEDLASRGWDEVSTEKLASAGLSEPCRRALPGATLRVDVSAEDQDSKRIHLRIGWRNASGEAAEELTAWKFHGQEAKR